MSIAGGPAGTGTASMGGANAGRKSRDHRRRGRTHLRTSFSPGMLVRMTVLAHLSPAASAALLLLAALAFAPASSRADPAHAHAPCAPSQVTAWLNDTRAARIFCGDDEPSTSAAYGKQLSAALQAASAAGISPKAALSAMRAHARCAADPREPADVTARAMKAFD